MWVSLLITIYFPILMYMLLWSCSKSLCSVLWIQAYSFIRFRILGLRFEVLDHFQMESCSLRDMNLLYSFTCSYSVLTSIICWRCFHNFSVHFLILLKWCYHRCLELEAGLQFFKKNYLMCLFLRPILCSFITISL